MTAGDRRATLIRVIRVVRGRILLVRIPTAAPGDPTRANTTHLTGMTKITEFGPENERKISVLFASLLGALRALRGRFLPFHAVVEFHGERLPAAGRLSVQVESLL
jgi:hypothetical protein